MQVVIDIETNKLHDADTLWCIVCKELESGSVHTWDYRTGYDEFKSFCNNVTEFIGHNLIAFDIPELKRLLSVSFEGKKITDTLILSRLLKFSIDGGHSLEAWGTRLGKKKEGLDLDFSIFSEEMIDRCKSDVEITALLYALLKKKILDDSNFRSAVEVEHEIATICKQMQDDGFKFNQSAAIALRDGLTKEIELIDHELETAFPPKIKPIREVTPKLTKHGTISRVGIPKDWDDLTIVSDGSPFTLVEYVPFNPGSPTQIIERLNQAGWSPVDKTSGHLEAEKSKDKAKLTKFRSIGWKVNETNLATVPDSAPPAAQYLVKRLLISGRWRTLNEWLEHYNPTDGRVHATFTGTGTWTGRMSHKAPNLGNVAAPKSIKYKGEGMGELAVALGTRMRALWESTPGWLLVGTDAVGIQLRIFAHYINDPQFTHAVTQGSSKNGDDPHTLNALILGVDRDTAKTFIYAFLLGAGDTKIGDIIGGSKRDGKEAKRLFTEAYPGLAKLRKEIIPRDASRGYFKSFDGRIVCCDSEHLMMAGYLQTGEACIMKHANVLWRKELDERGVTYRQVNFVHDEWQTEVDGDRSTAELVASIQQRSIRTVGERFNLKCPMDGDSRIGMNWYETH